MSYLAELNLMRSIRDVSRLDSGLGDPRLCAWLYPEKLLPFQWQTVCPWSLNSNISSSRRFSRSGCNWSVVESKVRLVWCKIRRKETKTKQKEKQKLSEMLESSFLCSGFMFRVCIVKRNNCFRCWNVTIFFLKRLAALEQWSSGLLTTRKFVPFSKTFPPPKANLLFWHLTFYFQPRISQHRNPPLLHVCFWSHNRWVPLCPNMDNLNSHKTQSPLLTHLLSLQC